MSMMPIYCSGCGDMLVHCSCYKIPPAQVLAMDTRWKKQTIFYDKEKGIIGNCMQACVASLFNLPMEAVPNFAAQPSWFQAFRKFITAQGYSLNSRFKEANSDLHIPAGLHLVSGKSSRGCEHM